MIGSAQDLSAALTLGRFRFPVQVGGHEVNHASGLLELPLLVEPAE
jgi:hypothetical protein